MDKAYKIRKSNKVGIKTKESHIVTRGNTSFLRIVGEYPHYQMWTATASEDDDNFLVCEEKGRLISAALQLGTELDTRPCYSKDRSGRVYIDICPNNIRPGSTSKVDDVPLDRALSRFFEIYDAFGPSTPEQRNQMQEIYQCFATDDSGDDVYLGDDVWLRNNGSTHESGR